MSTRSGLALAFTGQVGLGWKLSWIGPALLARVVRQAINDQLRTGTDKGNPTV